MEAARPPGHDTSQPLKAMGRRRHSSEEVINKLRQADVELGKGITVAGVCRLLGVSPCTRAFPYGHPFPATVLISAVTSSWSRLPSWLKSGSAWAARPEQSPETHAASASMSSWSTLPSPV